uniref:Retrovirus-related Pol polyprotein from transposon TNT 1-94-like beta-barrel domain-containing protein n=1 Tax=Nicotiana tabacum TaxID=4097 RepID=A0A1S4DA61_TOBAC
MKTSKELRNTLEKKYKTLDVGLKKFVAAKFLKFKMVDSKSVITQVQELQVIDHDLLVEGMVIYVAFQFAAFIENLPHMWKDFKNYLKHMPKEMTLGDLIVCLRIEEENKAVEMKSHENSTIMDENIVEEGSASKKRKKSSGPKNYQAKRSSKVISITMERKWWIDSGATRHVFANNELFTSYATAGPNKIVFMENSATIKIEGTDKIALKMTSSKIVTLKDVLHVPKMRKNLVSTSLQAKNGFKSVFVSDKVVGSKNEMYGGHRSVNVVVSAMKAELGYLRKSGIFCAPVSSQMRSMYHRSKGRHRIESCVAPTHAQKRKRVCGRKSDAAKVPIFFAEANIPGQILFLFGALVLFLRFGARSWATLERDFTTQIG